jgi:glycine/D-amino acid oxidase-like deaminating enzyme
MKFCPYWLDDISPLPAESLTPVSGHYDVAVIGGGFTGLGAARRLAMNGASVVLFEAESIGHGASGRNGGHLNNGLAHSFAAACTRFGEKQATAMYHAFDNGIDTIERIIAQEQIDCDFRRSGKLKLASKPNHMAAIARDFDSVRRLADPDTTLLTRDDLQGEIGSDIFHGGMLQKKSAMMHMGKFVVGLARAAVRHGATVHQHTAVDGCVKTARGFGLKTARGEITATNVLLATGAYTSHEFNWFRRRIVPVGSFLIATRPLTDSEVAQTLPGNRTCVTTMNIGNYFRLSPDKRLIFGGRARFSARSDQTADAKGGAILRRAMIHMFPHLAEIEIDYCWGGLVDMTADRYPRAGINNGLHYAMGYSGHGAQIATHMGEIMAAQMLGQACHNPWSELPWEAVPGHSGKPWFLPIVGAYYQLKDLIS